MKNITVFAVLVTIACSAYCQSRYSFSLAPQMGFVYGQAHELVYQYKLNDSEFLSKLDWDMKSVFYLGIQMDFERTDIMSAPGFFSSLSFKAGIPGDSGIMEDRDWRSTEHSNLTDFSSHTNRTREFFIIDFDIGASLPVRSWFYIKPFLSGSWMRFAFTGRDGYGKYHIGSPSYIEEDYTGQEVIRYKQDWFLIALGVNIGTKILYPFTFDISFKISPLIWCFSEDNHLTSSTIWLDFPKYGIFLEPAASVSLSEKRAVFSLEFAYRYIGKAKGDSYENKSNTGFSLIDNKAGAGLSVLDMRFLVKFRF